MPTPKKDIDPNQVLELARYGCTNTEIAHILYCSHDHIEQKYRAQLVAGRADRKSNLRRRQYQLAMEGNPAMLIFLGKNDLGQSDKHEVEHTNNPIEIVIAGATWKPDNALEIKPQYEELTNGSTEDNEEITAVQRLL